MYTLHHGAVLSSPGVRSFQNCSKESKLLVVVASLRKRFQRALDRTKILHRRYVEYGSQHIQAPAHVGVGLRSN